MLPEYYKQKHTMFEWGGTWKRIQLMEAHTTDGRSKKTINFKQSKYFCNKFLLKACMCTSAKIQQKIGGKTSI